ncbi:MAG TPA: 3-hydroxyisobutyrate dehydrogenase, partial [Marinobacter sp.]|nr:3-hydroxyisobutyrate dehydrogenase [Marinobacter sp.]
MAAITFIGLGNMGGPMASNLVKAGHTVTVFDLSKEAVAALVSEGAKSAATAHEAAAGAECVITMLPAGQHVEAVYLGDDGLLAKLPAGTLVIDSSTISPETARAVAEQATA